MTMTNPNPAGHGRNDDNGCGIQLMLLVILLLVVLACGSKAPDYVLRGWTVTPPPTATHTPVSTKPAVSPAPTIIYIYPSPVWYSATIRVDMLEIRNGPGTKYSSNPDHHLSAGDVITVMACRYDDKGEAWLNFYYPKEKIFGWAAATFRGQIFVAPMPARCGE